MRHLTHHPRPSRPISLRAMLFTAGAMVAALSTHVRAADAPAAAPYKAKVQPLLAKYCYDCHGEGENRGNITLDEFPSEEAMLHNRELWWKVLKNVRAGVMPPAKKPRPAADEQKELEQWVKYGVFGINPADPD